MTGYLTISDATADLSAGAVTSVELVERALTLCRDTDAVLGSFLAVFADQAMAAARAADAALAAGDEVGPLHGIPLGIKDIITSREAPSTAQSLILDPSWSDGDAVVVSRMRRAGGIVLGKTTTMEFAIGMPDPRKPFPVPRNPWDTSRWAGGSSSGSGSAVATGALLGALGTDTGGSIRVPAAYCGVSGLMPTFGRVPKSGCVPLGYSLDHIGPMARSARDCALMLGVIAGHDPSDVSSIDTPVPDYVSALDGHLGGVRIGVDRLSRAAGGRADPALGGLIDSALGEFRALGAELVDLELPFYDELMIANVVIMCSEALAYHLPDLQARWGDYSAGARAVIGSGALFTPADLVQAQRARRAGMKALAAVFRDVDLILTPTLSAGAPTFVELDEVMKNVLAGDFGPTHTPYWDTTGNPVLSVPMGFTQGGMPLGLQIAGRPFDEGLVLRAGDAFQRRTTHHRQRPALHGRAERALDHDPTQ